MNKTKNDEIYHRCTATELKEELCEKCPLTEIINKGIQEQILPQIRIQKSLLTEEQFNTWVNKEIELASASMQKARLAHIDQSKVHAGEWNALYHWNKARIQALNQVFIKNSNESNNFPVNLLELKPNQCQYLYSELTKDEYFIPKNTNQQHFNYVFGGGVCPSDFAPIRWNRSKQVLSELIILIVGKKSVPRQIQEKAGKVFVNSKNKSIGKLHNLKKDEHSDYMLLEPIVKGLNPTHLN